MLHNNNHSIVLPNRLKTTPLIQSLQRLEEEVCAPVLTNKESVYGLFLDELMQYYRAMPLQLDFSFLKTIRKQHTGRSELASEEGLQRAAEVLIEAKNKCIKEQITSFASLCLQYQQRCPNVLSTQRQSVKKHRNKSKTLNSGTIATQRFTKVLPPSKFLERVKSEGREENINHSQTGKRSSFLLHPKSIHFQSSSEMSSKVRVPTEGLDYKLPKIVQNNRALQQSIQSTIMRHKHIRVFFSPINRALKPTLEKTNLKSILFSSQHSTSPREDSVLALPKMKKGQVSLQLELPKQEEEPRRNRKLMLQLLRDKNRQTVLQ